MLWLPNMCSCIYGIFVSILVPDKPAEMFWQEYHSYLETTTVLQELKTLCVCAVRTAVPNESSHLFCCSVILYGSFLMYSRFWDVP